MIMKKIFITGGDGFIGTKLCELFGELGHQVHVYDTSDSYDVRNYNQLVAAIEHVKPTHVVHLGMTSKVNDAHKSFDYAQESIFGGTKNVLNALKEPRILGTVERLVFASSSTVYGNFITMPPAEDHPLNPVNEYGALKLCAEVLIKAHHEIYGLEYTIIRPSSVYGPWDFNLRVIGRFLLDAITKGEIDVYGPEMKMDFSYIDDVSDGFVRATLEEKAANETFNITRGQTRTLGFAANMVKSLIPTVKIIKHDADKMFPQRGAFNIDKAKTLLGYDPKIDLQQGIELYYKHMVNNWEGYD